MRVILFLLATFIACCGLYGIYAGIAAMLRGLGSMGRAKRRNKVQACSLVPESELPQVLDTCTAEPPASATETLHAQPISSYITELQTLFSLLQNGALSQEEFEQLKRHIFETIHQQRQMKEAL